MQLTRVALVAAAIGASGCGPESETPTDPDSGLPPCALGFLGDPAADPVMELVALGADEVSTPIVEGSEVALRFPPQGGRVIFVGVRATNIDACSAKLSGAVRDRTNHQVRVDTRTVNLQPTGDGWGASVDTNIATFSNVAMCPNQWATTDVFDHEFDLEVTLTDRDKVRKVKTIVRIVPTCAEPENVDECRCICKKGYVLGEPCGDAGTSETGP